MTEASPGAGLSRRALLAAGGFGALALGGFPRIGMAAPGTLRAAISGYGVVNTLDPAKAALIPEFYVIWACITGC